MMPSDNVTVPGTGPAPHIHHPDDVPRIMLTVLLALVPAAALTVLRSGLPALVTIVIAMAGCAGIEWLCLKFLRNPGSLRDGSALVTGMLLALLLPPNSPVWLILIGAGLTMVFGKHLYGGLGRNLFNPALVARLALLALFPAFSLQNSASPEMAAALLAGSAWLIFKRTIPWQIPLSFLLALALPALLLHAFAPARFPIPLYQVLGWATLLGALFMAAEPVTSPVSGTGMLIYGTGCGLLTGLFTLTGRIPTGFIPAILIMNLLVPLIDRTSFRERLAQPDTPAFMQGKPLMLLTTAIAALALSSLRLVF
ncbi:MAG: RnfABCDGE type electron transport complex subunit D [Fibrobacterota bacterium]